MGKKLWILLSGTEKRKDEKLSLPKLETFIAEFEKMKLVEMDLECVWNKAADLHDAGIDEMTWPEFKSAARGLSEVVEEEVVKRSKEDGKEMPDRFLHPDEFRYEVAKQVFGEKTFFLVLILFFSQQHPCYNTSAHQIGRKPTSVDMPMRWHGLFHLMRVLFALNRFFFAGSSGAFSQTFEVDTPGRGVTINLYRNRGLKTSKTYSKISDKLENHF